MRKMIFRRLPSAQGWLFPMKAFLMICLKERIRHFIRPKMEAEADAALKANKTYYDVSH